MTAREARRRTGTGANRRGGFRGIGGGGGGGTPPTISIAGTVEHGATLTATASGYTSLQWYAGATPISGETALTYVVDRADVSIGPAITCQATGPGGTTTSNALSYYPSQDFRDVYDAALGRTLVGSDLDQWASQGTGGNTMLAPAAANRPLYTASDADFGGEPSITFDGASEYMLVSAASMGGALSRFAAGGCWRIDAAVANGDYLVSYGNVATLRVSVGAGVPFITMNATNAIATTNSRSSTRCLSGAGTYGTSQAVYVSGTSEASAAIGGTTIADSQGLSIGGSVTGTATAPVKVALVVVGVSAAAVAVRAQLDLDAYCKWRFGAV